MRSRMGPKCETDPSAPAVHMENLGEVLLEALHPQTMQVNTRVFCGELPLPSGRRLNSSLPDHRRVFVGIGEGSHSARRHPDLTGGCSTQCAGRPATVAVTLKQVN